MNLIDRYITEVTERIPEQEREDIALELRSIIYDMLPEEYEEDDVYQALETLGNPAVLANKYSEKPMHLIGPRYYDAYISFLKLLIPLAIMVALISTIAINFLQLADEGALFESLLTIFSESIWRSISTFIHLFFWLTLIFICIERADSSKSTSPLSTQLKPWTPKDLQGTIPLPKQKAIKPSGLYASLLWTAFWGTVYYYAHQLVGIYESSSAGFYLTIPAFSQAVLRSFWPLVLSLIVGEVLLVIYKGIAKQWTAGLATWYSIKEIASLIIFTMILLQANVFEAAFIDYLSDLFTVDPLILQNRIVWGIIFVLIISMMLSIFDAYRKAYTKGTIESENTAAK